MPNAAPENALTARQLLGQLAGVRDLDVPVEIRVDGRICLITALDVYTDDQLLIARVEERAR